MSNKLEIILTIIMFALLFAPTLALLSLVIAP